MSADGRAQGIQVEEVHGVGQPVLDQHAPGVAEDEGREGRRGVVGQEDGGRLVAQVPVMKSRRSGSG